MSWLIAVLVVAGVLAAMTGDRLGHRLGKKRVSLFSLRPRHSGTLATCVAGGLIALVLSPLAIWGAGLLTPAADPVYVAVPMARRVPVQALAAPVAVTARPSLTPVFVPVSAMPVAGAVPAMMPVTAPSAATPVTVPVAQLQQQLAVAKNEIGTLRKALATKPAPERVAAGEPLVARHGELLASAQVPGGLGPQAAQQALRDVLNLVERYGQRRGAGSGLAVAGSQVAELTNRLQTIGAFVLHVQADRNARRGEPLTVQLSLQAMPPGSLAEWQERDRVEHSATSAQAAVEQALAQVPAGGSLAALPAEAYVPMTEALKTQEHKTRLVWRGETVSGGPLMLRVSPDSTGR
ncbi:MAG: DUF3084 domain-containing protein [Candidatus Sericytochromatia bacterium]|nr:DUF3084 domain-containing protein [Candidatus Sericytochromatia bacterium]